MSTLTFTEKRKFEALFGMSSGYVLDFSNRTFDEFVLESIGLSLFDEKYNHESGSKANRLRSFWIQESDDIVAKLLADLMQCYSLETASLEDQKIFYDCKQTVIRLNGNSNLPEVISLKPNSPEKEFAVLARAVREAIERNEPEIGLDRLHTYTIKYLRVLCENYGIMTNKEKPLHSLIGEYVKKLKDNNRIKSEMTERILKSSISTLESFNTVRNSQSLAHDNVILNYDESLLIYYHVAHSIRFIETIERQSI